MPGSFEATASSSGVKPFCGSPTHTPRDIAAAISARADGAPFPGELPSGPAA